MVEKELILILDLIVQIYFSLDTGGNKYRFDILLADMVSILFDPFYTDHLKV